jgi:bifunctional non-homologous end joining protein LigD
MAAAMRFVPPMAALLVERLPAGAEWMYEAKFDGYRALAMKDGAKVKILSRKGNDLTDGYPAVRAAVAALDAHTAILDGEIVAFDESGRPSFQQLQHRTAKGAAIRYFAFDLLHLNGKDLQSEPLTVRRRSLQHLVARSEVEFSDELPGAPDQVLQAVAQVGLEGVVAKRRDSRYEPGKRSGAWQKFKLKHRQEFVIGGYKPENKTFQSIVVGYYEGKDLHFAGRVRAGFTAAQRTAVFEMLRPLQITQCPFADLPTGKTSHWGEGVTEEDMKVLKWVKPALVVDIAFTEWTRDGHLRHSAFVGLRTDKRARDVVRERCQRPGG